MHTQHDTLPELTCGANGLQWKNIADNEAGQQLVEDGFVAAARAWHKASPLPAPSAGNSYGSGQKSILGFEHNQNARNETLDSRVNTPSRSSSALSTQSEPLKAHSDWNSLNASWASSGPRQVFAPDQGGAPQTAPVRSRARPASASLPRALSRGSSANSQQAALDSIETSLPYHILQVGETRWAAGKRGEGMPRRARMKDWNQDVTKSALQDAIQDWKVIQSRSQVKGGLLMPTPVGLRPALDEVETLTSSQVTGALCGIVEELSGDAGAAKMEDADLDNINAKRRQDMINVSKALVQREFEMEKHKAPAHQSHASRTTQTAKDKQRWGRPASAATRLQTLHDVSKLDGRSATSLRRSQPPRPQSAATASGNSWYTSVANEPIERRQYHAPEEDTPHQRPATAQASSRNEYQLSTCNLSVSAEAEDAKKLPRPATAPPRQDTRPPSVFADSRKRTSLRLVSREQPPDYRSIGDTQGGAPVFDLSALGPLAPSAREVIMRSTREQRLSSIDAFHLTEADGEGARGTGAMSSGLSTEAVAAGAVSALSDERKHLAHTLNVKLSHAHLEYHLAPSPAAEDGGGQEGGTERSAGSHPHVDSSLPRDDSHRPGGEVDASSLSQMHPSSTLCCIVLQCMVPFCSNQHANEGTLVDELLCPQGWPLGRFPKRAHPRTPDLAARLLFQTFPHSVGPEKGPVGVSSAHSQPPLATRSRHLREPSCTSILEGDALYRCVQRST